MFTLAPINFDPNTIYPLPPNQPTNYGPALFGAGGGFSAAANVIAGNQSANLLRANATLARQQAVGELQAGAEQGDLYKQHLDAVLGSQIAKTGGSGLTSSGSPLRSLETTAYLGAQDLERISVNAQRKAWGFNTSAEGDDVRAQMAGQTGRMGAIGQLITSGARAYGSWASQD